MEELQSIVDEEFIDSLLKIRQLVQIKAQQSFSEKNIKHFELMDILYEQPGEKALIVECMFLSFWIITLSLSAYSKELKDVFYEKFCEDSELDKEEEKLFFSELTKRFKHYYYAMDLYKKGNDSALGSVLSLIVRDQNNRFLNEEPVGGPVYLTNPIEDIHFQIIFADIFNYSNNLINEIEGIRKMY